MVGGEPRRGTKRFVLPVSCHSGRQCCQGLRYRCILDNDSRGDGLLMHIVC